MAPAPKAAVAGDPLALYARVSAQVACVFSPSFWLRPSATIRVYLVREYLAIYHQHDSREYRERLTEQIERLSKAPQAKKGAL